MSRVLVTGAAGMLGSEVLLRAPPGIACVGTDLAPGVAAPGVDLADPAAVARLLAEHGPFDGVIHCAAFTAVDRAEEEEALALRVNAEACAVLGSALAGARFVAVGTDFVFDGRAARPYREEDPPAPLSAYGRTKLAGEEALRAAHPGAAIVRTQWLYGPRGAHFPRTIVGHARRLGALRVVDDQIGSPTSTVELAPALWDVLCAGASGLFHGACAGSCSWHGFTAAILEELGLAEEVALEPCRSSEFPRPAPRPAYSVLDASKLERLRGRPFKPWREALRDYLALETL